MATAAKKATAKKAEPPTTEQAEKGEQGVPPAEALSGNQQVERDAEAVADRAQYRADHELHNELASAPLRAEEVRPGVRVEKREDLPNQTQTDDVAGAAAVQSLAGQESTKVFDEDDNEITSAEGLFEDYQDGTVMRVTKRVLEGFTPRNTTTEGRRLLFAEGELIPRARAAAFTKALEG